MGLLQEILDRWAGSGSKESPEVEVPGKVTAGMANNNQFPMEWYNWANDRIEEQIKQIIHHSYGPSSINLTRDQLVQKRFSTSGLDGRPWGAMFDAHNTINYGTNTVVGLEIYYPADDEDNADYEYPRLLVLDRSNRKIVEYNTFDMTTRDSGVLGNLPTGSGEQWDPTAFHSDNVNVYVMFSDIASTNQKRIQAYKLSDWSLASGWPGNGILLTSTTGAPKVRDAIISVSDTQILALDSDISVSAATSPALVLLNKSDGTITDSGAGDCPTGASYFATAAVCTDETNVYFGMTSASASGYLCSALLSNLQAGTGATGYPQVGFAGTGSSTQSIIWTGDYIISAWEPVAMQNTFLLVSTPSSANFMRYQLSSGHPYADFYARHMVWDGRRIWMRIEDVLGASSKPVVIAINPGGFSNHISGEVLDTYIEHAFAFDSSLAFSASVQVGKYLAFDGASVWNLSYSAAGINDRLIRRIPNVTGM